MSSIEIIKENSLNNLVFFFKVNCSPLKYFPVSGKCPTKEDEGRCVRQSVLKLSDFMNFVLWVIYVSIYH